MTAKQLAKELELTALTDCGDDKEVDGCYICDLLSYVMSHASKGNVWITVQTNINVVAVASLTEVSCVIIPENIEVEDITLKKAVAENITFFSSPHTAYELAGKLSEII